MIWMLSAALAAQTNDTDCTADARESVRVLTELSQAWRQAESDSREQTWVHVHNNPDDDAKQAWIERHDLLVTETSALRERVGAIPPDPHGVHAAVVAGVDLRLEELRGPAAELLELQFKQPMRWDTVLEAEALVAAMQSGRAQVDATLRSAMDTHIAQCGPIPAPPEGQTPTVAIQPFQAHTVPWDSPLSDGQLLGFAVAHHNGAVGVHNAMVEATWGWTGTVREFHQAHADVVTVLEAARDFAQDMGPFAGSTVLADGLLGMAEAHLAEMNGRGLEIADLRGARIVTGARYRKADELWNHQRKAFRDAEQIFDDAVHSFRNDWGIQEYMLWYRDEVTRKR